MSPAVLKPRIDALWAVIGAQVMADPRRGGVDPVASKEQIKSFIDQRTAALQAAGF